MTRSKSKHEAETGSRAKLQGESPGGFLRERVRGEVVVEVGRVQGRRHLVPAGDPGDGDGDTAEESLAMGREQVRLGVNEASELMMCGSKRTARAS